jgi:hypothetical protein
LGDAPSKSGLSVPALALAAILAGAGLIAVSLLDYSFFGRRSASLLIGPLAQNPAPEFVRALTLRSRIFGWILVALGILAWIARQPLASLLHETVSSVRESWPAFRRDLGRGVRSERAPYLLALFLFTAVGAVLRFHYLFQPVRYDEAFSYLTFASKPLYFCASVLSAPNNHILHNLLTHVLARAFGDAPWVLRLEPFSAGILIAPAGYLAARMFYGRNTALLTAAALASSSFLIEYSTNGRGYSLLVLVFLLVLALARYVAVSGNAAGWCLLALLTVIGFYTIPLMLHAFGTVAVWIVLSALARDTVTPPRAVLRNLALWTAVAAVFTFALYLPVLVVTGIAPLIAHPSTIPHPWPGLIANLRVLGFDVWSTWNRDIPDWLAIALAAGFVVSLLPGRRAAQTRIPLPLCAILWCAPFLLFKRMMPWSRLWLFLLPVYIAAAMHGIVWLLTFALGRRRALPAIVFTAAFAICGGLALDVWRSRSILDSPQTGAFPEAEQAAALLASAMRPEDAVVAVDPERMPLQYYLHRHGVSPGCMFRAPRPDGTDFLFVPDSTTLNRMLDESPPPAGFRAITLLARYSHSSLYEIRATP